MNRGCLDLRLVALGLAVLCGAARAADTAPARMQWTDLRSGQPAAVAQAQLWDDRLQAARRHWKQAVALPAYTLTQTFAAASPPVAVSILFDMFDCELPGNGAGADLFARCPMRVVSGAAAAATVQTIEQVCMLYLPAGERPAEGPDPSLNHTEVTLDAARILRLRVVQDGRRVAACDLDRRLE